MNGKIVKTVKKVLEQAKRLLKMEDEKIWRETFKHNNSPIVIQRYKWGHMISTGTLILKYRNETGETFCLNEKGGWELWPAFNPKMENWTDGKKLKFNY